MNAKFSRRLIAYLIDFAFIAAILMIQAFEVDISVLLTIWYRGSLILLFALIQVCKWSI